MMAFSLARLKGRTISLQDKLEGRCKRKICFDVIEFKKNLNWVTTQHKQVSAGKNEENQLLKGVQVSAFKGKSPRVIFLSNKKKI